MLDETLLKTFSSLKWIARLGSGMEIIDTNYCNFNGIKYFNSPNGIANSVAEHTMGMMLSLLHQIPHSTQSIKKGKWAREKHRGVELSGKTIGIIGFGHTGKALAKKLSVFTKNILIYDKYCSNFQVEYIKESNIEDIQQHADIISFHVPLNEETKNYYNLEFCLKMRKEHILVNTSRGPIAPTHVIIEGLKNGKIKGACLDVFGRRRKYKSSFRK
ncbi:MAG: Phosphoglycerate dehydrogenase [Bacteroidetes bacterium OLB11]|nr:MAG: Phosphoglycerate dehydrogenase [Bacteroidetes bacterium OLB11]